MAGRHARLGENSSGDSQDGKVVLSSHNDSVRDGKRAALLGGRINECCSCS